MNTSIRMNNSMRRILDGAGVSLPQALYAASPDSLPELKTIGGSVVFANQAETTRHVMVDDFPDRTGYEAFLNHFHLPWDGTGNAIQGLIRKIAGIRQSLRRYAPETSFLVIVGVGGGECTVRFHELRSGESWLDPDLEGYKEEAVAAIGVGPEG
jgi:hypothetical protein